MQSSCGKQGAQDTLLMTYNCFDIASLVHCINRKGTYNVNGCRTDGSCHSTVSDYQPITITIKCKFLLVTRIEDEYISSCCIKLTIRVELWTVEQWKKTSFL